MKFRNLILTAGLAASVLLGACASQPATDAHPAPVAAAAPAPTAAAAEADTAAGMEKRFQEAARSYKIVQKDGKTMYCKREKVMGSTIPTLQCISEAQLRIQVENTDELRQRMRNKAGGCMQGCAGGG
jgi:hypothetical protein